MKSLYGLILFIFCMIMFLPIWSEWWDNSDGSDKMLICAAILGLFLFCIGLFGPMLHSLSTWLNL
jgi:hypothetical protein